MMSTNRTAVPSFAAAGLVLIFSAVLYFYSAGIEGVDRLGNLVVGGSALAAVMCFLERTGLPSLVVAGAVLTAVGCSFVFGDVAQNLGFGAIALAMMVYCRCAIAVFSALYF
jgi:hypothetical protein